MRDFTDTKIVTIVGQIKETMILQKYAVIVVLNGADKISCIMTRKILKNIPINTHIKIVGKMATMDNHEYLIITQIHFC